MSEGSPYTTNFADWTAENQPENVEERIELRNAADGISGPTFKSEVFGEEIWIWKKGKILRLVTLRAREGFKRGLESRHPDDWTMEERFELQLSLQDSKD